MREFLVLGLLVAVIGAGAYLFLGGTDYTYTTDCPEDIETKCNQLSTEYSSNATFLYTSGSSEEGDLIYYVRLESHREQFNSSKQSIVQVQDNRTKKIIPQ